MSLGDEKNTILYGDGLFETVKIKDGKILNLEDHYERLSKALLFFDMGQISLDCFESEIMKSYGLDCKAVVKLTCLKSKEGRKILLTSRDNVYTEEIYQKGYRLKKSVFMKNSKNNLLQYKTTKIEESILEKKQLLESDFQESLHFNEAGFMTEGIYCNVFFIKNKKVFTPHTDSGVLAGVQRKNVLKALKKLGLFCEIGYYKEEALYHADEVFMTNAVMGIMPVSKYEQCTYDLSQNHITKSLMEAYKNGLL